nr:PhnA domain-containing protein [Mucilaginibacter gracilis]
MDAEDGSLLADGDSVLLTKTLDVKDQPVPLKMGT